MPTNSDEQLNAIKPGVELEYNALRSEILKRIEMRQQNIFITLSIAGVILGFGLDYPGVAFIYPPIAFLLGLAWAENDIRIRQLGRYIRDRHEKSIPGLGWEMYRIDTIRESRFGRLPFIGISIGGIFLFTQLIAVAVGIAKFASTPVEWGLLVVDAITILLVVLLSNYLQRSETG